MIQEVRDWLRKPENRTRYLDDLVWLIHDRFGIVCSTTTMSKMKRKWLRVIEYEETGRPIDAVTRNSLLETHPDLPVLHDQEAMPEYGVEPTYSMPPPAPMMSAPQAMMQSSPYAHGHLGEIPIEPQIDSQLEQQIQSEIASAGGPMR